MIGFECFGVCCFISLYIFFMWLLYKCMLKLKCINVLVM